MNLPKHLTITLVSGHSVVMRHRIVVRWQKVEESAVPAAAFQVPTTLAGALRLAAEQAEQIEQQQALLNQQAPAVAFVQRYVETNNNLGVREVAKVLNVRQTAFVRRIIDKAADVRDEHFKVIDGTHTQGGNRTLIASQARRVADDMAAELAAELADV